jgi:hypothetical protein
MINKKVFSLRKQILHSTKPTCLEAVAKLKIGVVGRDETLSVIQANFPSLAISTM